jgi:hypothetical protein
MISTVETVPNVSLHRTFYKPNKLDTPLQARLIIYDVVVEVCTAYPKNLSLLGKVRLVVFPTDGENF